MRQLEDDSGSDDSDAVEEADEPADAHAAAADASGADALAAVWLSSGAGVRRTLLNGLRSTGVCFLGFKTACSAICSVYGLHVLKHLHAS